MSREITIDFVLQALGPPGSDGLGGDAANDVPDPDPGGAGAGGKGGGRSAVAASGGRKGDPRAFRDLYEEMFRVIHARVARVLDRYAPKNRCTRQEVADLIQYVFLRLIQNDWRALRRWDPKRGRSFLNWVGMIAVAETLSILRGPRSPWPDDPTEADVFTDLPDSRPDPEILAAGKELVQRIYEAMMQALTDRGRRMFHLLSIERLSIEEICELEQMKEGAVRRWQSRLDELARKITCRLMLKIERTRRMPPRRDP